MECPFLPLPVVTPITLPLFQILTILPDTSPNLPYLRSYLCPFSVDKPSLLWKARCLALVFLEAQIVMMLEQGEEAEEGEAKTTLIFQALPMYQARGFSCISSFSNSPMR